MPIKEHGGFALHRHAEHVVGALLFTACYVALDWASYIYPLGAFNITPWNPPPALSVVWMLLGGMGYAVVVFGAAVLADLLIRHAPGGIWVTLQTSLALAVGYAAMALVLKRVFQFSVRLRDSRQLWILVVVSALGAATVAALYVGVLALQGFLGGDSFADATLRFWLGDAVGILVTAPLLLVAADPAGRRRVYQSWRRPETLLQFAVLALAIAFVFGRTGEASRFFYVLFVPLIWIALRGGLPGAVIASGVVQMGVVLSAHGGMVNSPAVVELQALVATFTLTGLFLGAMVDERERAAEQLKQSLRLAAAGETAGAIAHEINQPIAALANYGKACQLMLEQGKGQIPRSDLEATIAKMLGEAKRAAEVVARLRDFFRSGTTRLENVALADLLQRARHIGSDLNRDGRVDFGVEGGRGGTVLLIDRLQIELVLRNLIANAFEAVAVRPPGERRVRLSVQAGDDHAVVFRVSDSGPGLTTSARERLFEPFSSGKSTGMGLGLAISRAIVEAHGGSLAARSAEHGEFVLALPARGDDE